jgi:hypothetical protein
MFGPQIERPWVDFLASAETALSHHPELLADLRHNTSLRRRVVALVEAEQT